MNDENELKKIVKKLFELSHDLEKTQIVVFGDVLGTNYSLIFSILGGEKQDETINI